MNPPHFVFSIPILFLTLCSWHKVCVDLLITITFCLESPAECFRFILYKSWAMFFFGGAGN